MAKNNKLWKPFPFYDKENNILIDWSAKAGSALVASMFFEHMGLLDAAHKHNLWIHRYRTEIFQGKDRKKNYPFPLTPEKLLSKKVYKIKIIRNPFTRAVSSYCHTMGRKLGALHNFTTQDSFIDFLKNISLPNSAQDIHWSSQIRAVEKTHQGFFNKVCKLENLTEDLKSVNEDLGTSFDFESQSGKSRTPHHTRRKPGSSSCVSALPHVANVPWSQFDVADVPDYKYFYNQESYDLVSKIYREDIELYKYSYEEVESWDDFIKRIK